MGILKILWWIIKIGLSLFLVLSGVFIMALSLGKDARLFDLFDSGLVWFIIGLSLALTGIFMVIKQINYD
jgi:hypothetical protein